MSELYNVPLKELVREFDMKVEYAATDFDVVRLTVADLSRPGLQLAGYFEHFGKERVQIIGLVEYTYIEKMTRERKREIFTQLFAGKSPCVIFCRSLEPDEEIIELWEVA